MSTPDPATDTTRKALRHDRIAFRLFFVLCFPLFLLTAIVRRLRPSPPAFTSGVHQKRKPVFAEARAAANTVLPFAFMGW